MKLKRSRHFWNNIIVSGRVSLVASLSEQTLHTMDAVASTHSKVYRANKPKRPHLYLLIHFNHGKLCTKPLPLFLIPNLFRVQITSQTGIHLIPGVETTEAR